MAEIVYREQGKVGNAYTINAYVDNKWVLTYRGYIGRNPYVMTLYPSVIGNHSGGGKLPGKHSVSIYKIGKE